MNNKNLNCLVIFILIILFFVLKKIKYDYNLIIIIGLLIILFNYNLIQNTDFFNNNIELFNVRNNQDKLINYTDELLKYKNTLDADFSESQDYYNEIDVRYSLIKPKLKYKKNVEILDKICPLNLDPTLNFKNAN